MLLHIIAGRNKCRLHGCAGRQLEALHLVSLEPCSMCFFLLIWICIFFHCIKLQLYNGLLSSVCPPSESLDREGDFGDFLNYSQIGILCYRKLALGLKIFSNNSHLFLSQLRFTGKSPSMFGSEMPQLDNLNHCSCHLEGRWWLVSDASASFIHY